MKSIKGLLLKGVVLSFMLLILSGCKSNKEVETFFATFFFMVTMIIGGIPSIVFTAISLQSPKQAIKILGIVFTSIFGLFCLFMLPMYGEFWRHGYSEWVAMLTFLQYGTLIGCLVMMIIGISNKQKALLENNSVEQANPKHEEKPMEPQQKEDDDNLDYLDKFLEEE